MNREIDHTDRTRRIGTTRIGSVGAILLFLLGLSLVAAGGALAAAPYYAAPNPSGDYWRYANLAASHGIKFDMVVVTGLILMGLGLVGRSVSRLAKIIGRLQDQGTGGSQVTGQLATDMTHTMRTLSTVVQSLNQASHEQRSEKTDPDALFRLAASLDQLGVRLDLRMKSELGTISSQIEMSARGLQSLTERISALESSLVSKDRSGLAPTTPAMREEPTAGLPDEQDVVTTALDAQDEVLDLFDRMEGEVAVDSPANRAQIALDAPSVQAQIPLDLPPGYESTLDQTPPEDVLRDALDRDR
jgi:signal transduction histidine kinase